ncbi:crossover junction endodeoxyribonuclease RuvC [Candidatus Pacebacteria bacterium]|nr:crossover junction endodeoxyribonuclease RuvC [Candidatus Paceibacterota bacterium]
MKIIAIDPGYERLGIAIVEKNKGDRKETLLFSECFKTSAKDPHHQRLAELSAEMEKVIKEYKPTALAIETLFFSKNTKTALKVAEARGVIIERCSTNGLEIFEFSPAEIKIAVTGSGSSDKNHVMKMVPLLIDMNIKNETLKKIQGDGVEKKVLKKQDDEYDAIAAGLTFFATKNSFHR